MSIAGYYQCYKQPKAFEHSLQEFRKHYPTSELWIVNDGGDPTLGSISKKYNATHYELLKRIDTNAITTIYTEMSQLIEWFRRLREFIMSTKADFFILLEDDVFVMAPTKISDLKYDINGCNKACRFDYRVEHIIRLRNPNVPSALYELYSGGFGGCFMRISFMKRMLENFDAIINNINIYSQYSNLFASDIVLSYLVWSYGGTIEMYPGLAETWYEDITQRLASGSVEVLHKYKDLYE